MRHQPGNGRAADAGGGHWRKARAEDFTVPLPKGRHFRHGAADGNRRNRRRAAQPNKGTVHRRIKTALRCKKAESCFPIFQLPFIFLI